jgi:hypothetical protein
MMADAPPFPAEGSGAVARAIGSGAVGTWHWDIGSEAVTWDRTLSAVYGIAPGAAPRTAPAFLALVHPEDRDVTVRKVSRAVEGATSIEHQFRAMVDGRTLLIHDRAHVIRDRDGRALSMIGACYAAGEKTVSMDDAPAEARDIDAAGFLNTVLASVARDAHGHARLAIAPRIDALTLPFCTAVRFGVILAELIAPAGSVPKPELDRKIGVSLQAMRGEIRLAIAEDRPAAATEGRAIGVVTAGALARQLGGTLWNDQDGGGVRLRLVFPLGT